MFSNDIIKSSDGVAWKYSTQETIRNQTKNLLRSHEMGLPYLHYINKYIYINGDLHMYFFSR